jgi:hypothetical protein
MKRGSYAKDLDWNEGFKDYQWEIKGLAKGYGCRNARTYINT